MHYTHRVSLNIEQDILKAKSILYFIKDGYLNIFKCKRGIKIKFEKQSLNLTNRN